MSKKRRLAARLEETRPEIRHHKSDIEDADDLFREKDPQTRGVNHGPANKQSGELNEKIASRVTGLQQTAGSGCGLIEKGDLSSQHILVEAKATTTDELRIERGWWKKLKRQAKEMHKSVYLLQVAFLNRQVPPNVMPFMRWLLIPQSLFWDSYTADNPPTLDSKQTTWTWNQHQSPKEPFLLLIDGEAVVAFPEHWFTSEVQAQILKEIE